MLAFKLQTLTTRTLLRPSQLRFVQGSTVSLRTYKHGWRTINNPHRYRSLSPMVQSVRVKRSPRTRFSSRQKPNGDLPNTSEETASPLIFICALVFLFIIGECDRRPAPEKESGLGAK
jgi:hypothetical protein